MMHLINKNPLQKSSDKTSGERAETGANNKTDLFIDNRPESAALRSLHDMASSAAVRQLRKNQDTVSKDASSAPVIQLKYGEIEKIEYPDFMEHQRHKYRYSQGADALANFAYDYDTHIVYWSNRSGKDKHTEDKIWKDRGDPKDKAISIYTERFPCSVCDSLIEKTKTVWNVQYSYDGDEATEDIARWLINNYGGYTYKRSWQTAWPPVLTKEGQPVKQGGESPKDKKDEHKKVEYKKGEHKKAEHKKKAPAKR
ncbi:hypothetical protein KK083_19390 [Fulvivirgaceae bacterium PWU4]|uniref:Uncharacterized protein n=1 Tax=Chryseosolibacter histidini TaxID=2782349 RepID=A0AAP2GPF7_9BACT|nr:hypothetical protein [Chryseosolibacter histidini]MBT1699068.1 hypothetical protein [Chryseosolibacter histidini]